MIATMSSTGSARCSAFARQLDRRVVRRRAERLVELVAADSAEVVAAEVEEQAGSTSARALSHGGRVAGPQLLVDLDERLRPGSGPGPCRGSAAMNWWSRVVVDTA